MVLKSMVLFALAAVLEIGGAWLVWQGVREHRGWAFVGAGVIALGACCIVSSAVSSTDSIAASAAPAQTIRGESAAPSPVHHA